MYRVIESVGLNRVRSLFLLVRIRGKTISVVSNSYEMVKNEMILKAIEPSRNCPSNSASVIEAKTSYASCSHLKSIRYTAACVALQNRNESKRAKDFFIFRFRWVKKCLLLTKKILTRKVALCVHFGNV